MLSHIPPSLFGNFLLSKLWRSNSIRLYMRHWHQVKIKVEPISSNEAASCPTKSIIRHSFSIIQVLEKIRLNSISLALEDEKDKTNLLDEERRTRSIPKNDNYQLNSKQKKNKQKKHKDRPALTLLSNPLRTHFSCICNYTLIS